MGAPASRLSLYAVLALSTPAVLCALAVPSSAHAQQAVFSDVVFDLIPPGQVVADGLTPVTLSFLALGPDGMPLTGLALKATVAGGKVGAVEQVGAGVYRVSWVPPRVDAARSFDLFIKGKTVDKRNIDKRWSIAAAPTLAQMVTVAASPAQLVLGQDTGATLNIVLTGGPSQPLDGVELDLRATAGTLTNVTHLGGGKFTALYTPPTQPFPQLALITVADKRDPSRTYGSLAIPLVGKASFPVAGLPNSRVIVKVGEREFGPIQANAAGQASVPLVVPPGVDKGTVVSVVGEQRKEENLDLKVPASPRLAFFPLPKAAPADATQTVPVRLFVSTPTGAPDPGAQLTLTASAGTISAVRHEGNGVYAATYTPPSGGAATSVSLQATLADARGNQSSASSLSLVPVRPAAVKLTLDPPTLPAEGGTVRVLANVTGPNGQGLPGRNLAFGIDGAQIQGGVKDLGAGDYSVTLAPTGSGPIDLVATVTAKASGNPLRQVLAFASRERVPNDGLSSTMITVLTLDEFGYPVANVPVKVSVTQGDGKVPAQGKTNDTGVAQLYYTAGRTAGLVTLRVQAGDHAGAVSVLQAPTGVAAGIALPASGADTTLKLASAWRNIVKGARVERTSPAAVAPISAAPAPSWGAASALPVSRLSVVAIPATAAPGQMVELEITALDAQGAGVDGQNLDFLSSQGTVAAARPTGTGRYKATLTVPPDATGEIKVSVALADGSVSSFLKVPVGAATTAVWGAAAPAAPAAPAEPTWGAAATPAEPVTTTPVATTPVTPVATPVAATPVSPPATATRTRTPRTPPSSEGRPWLRAQVGYAGGLYSYVQEPVSEDSPLYPGRSPLYPGRIAFGSLSETEGSTGAVFSGLQAAARAWIPGVEWLGLEGSFRSSYYSVEIPTADAVIPDWVTHVRAGVVPRYRFDAGSSQLHLGGRVGFSVGDLMVYQQPTGSNQLSYGPLPVPALDLGAEFGGEFGSRFFGGLGYTLGLANGSDPFSHTLGLDLGVSFGSMFLDLGASRQARATPVLLNPDDPNQQTAEAGSLQDRTSLITLGLGYQM